MIFGVTGACRREELTNLAYSDIEDHKTMLVVKIPKTKTYIQRTFTIVGEFYNICNKYISLRPTTCKLDRFFLSYYNGKCTRQPIGINTMGSIPKKIAQFLNLRDSVNYTGHSFRRTSATLLVDGGADITTLKRHGGWKSNTVAESYVESSMNNKKRIAEQITSSIAIEPTTSTVEKGPSAPKIARLLTNNEVIPEQNTSISTIPPIEICEKNVVLPQLQNDTEKNVSYIFNNCTITMSVNHK